MKKSLLNIHQVPYMDLETCGFAEDRILMIFIVVAMYMLLNLFSVKLSSVLLFVWL